MPQTDIEYVELIWSIYASGVKKLSHVYVVVMRTFNYHFHTLTKSNIKDLYYRVLNNNSVRTAVKQLIAPDPAHCNHAQLIPTTISCQNF